LSHWSLRNILTIDCVKDPTALEEWFTLFPDMTALSPIVGQDFFISLPQGAQTGSQKCQLHCCSRYDISGGHTIALDGASVTDCSPHLQPRCAPQPHPLNQKHDRLIARTDPDTGSACT